MLQQSIRRQNKNSKKLKIVFNFVASKGGLIFATNMMYDFRNKAVELLSTYPDSEIKASLIEFINYRID